MTRIEAELRRRFEVSGYQPITIIMKCNNDRIKITPCSYLPEIKSIEQISFFLMDSQFVNFSGGESISYIAECIENYESRLQEDVDGVAQLKAHIRKYGKNSDWDYVSDFHKDLFGHRPHVGIDNLINWAWSDSIDSARKSIGYY